MTFQVYFIIGEITILLCLLFNKGNIIEHMRKSDLLIIAASLWVGIWIWPLIVIDSLVAWMEGE